MDLSLNWLKNRESVLAELQRMGKKENLLGLKFEGWMQPDEGTFSPYIQVISDVIAGAWGKKF